MATKPTIKKEVALAMISEAAGVIYFYATRDAVTEFAGFGQIRDAGGADYYWLEVDTRFDFQEVVNFIRDYGRG